MTENSDPLDLEAQVQLRCLLITVDDSDGTIDVSGDRFAEWEFYGIAKYLELYGFDDDPDAEDDDE